MREVFLEARIPYSEIILGRAYLISARNGSIGVAIRTQVLEYRLRRVKFNRVFLDDEIDWEDSTVHGTAIPLKLLEEIPPTDKTLLLDWLKELEIKYASEIDKVWEEHLRKKENDRNLL